MWVSPNHPNPPRTAAPPQDDGVELATFPRGDGKELRIRLKTYNNNPYISLVLWERGWPVKGRSLSIRLREVEAMTEALQRAGELAETIERPAPEPARKPPPRRTTGVKPPFDPGSAAAGYRPNFDECN
jgi:hypothetical protein